MTSLPHVEGLSLKGQAALNCAEVGISVIPIRPGTKRPYYNGGHKIATTDRDTIIGWWTAHPTADIGVVTGEKSNRLYDVDLDCTEAIQIARAILTETNIFGRAGKRASHYLYYLDKIAKSIKLTDPMRKDRADVANDKATIIELRGDGHFTVFPPSDHASGEIIEWESETPIAQVTSAGLLRDIYTIGAFALVLRYYPPIGTRNDFFLPFSGMLLRSGYTRDEAMSLVEMLCGLKNDEEIRQRIEIVRSTYEKQEDGEPITGLTTMLDCMDETVARRINTYLFRANGRVDIGDAGEHRYTDDWSARLLEDKHGEDIRYCAEIKNWLVWNTIYWERDITKKVMRFVRDTITEIERAARTETTEDEHRAAHGWMKYVLSERGNSAIVKYASSKIESVITQVDQWDNKPHLLVCQNGTLNLDTQELQPHDREDYLSKAIQYSYRKHVDLAILIVMMARSIGDAGKLRELQKGFGLALSGGMDKVIFFCYGPTDAGKSTALNALYTLLEGVHANGYSKQISLSYMMDGNRDKKSMWAADLRGARFALASELPKNFVLDSATFKSISGGNMQKAEAKYEMPQDYKPTYSLFVDTNYLPDVKDMDSAMENRIRLIHFRHNVKMQAGDDGYIPDFSSRVQSPEEMEKLLEWAVEGYRMWKEEGFVETAEMKNEKQEYVEEQERLYDYDPFLDSYFIFRPKDESVRVAVREVDTLCERWGQSIDRFNFRLDRDKLRRALEKRGAMRKNARVGDKIAKCWVGVEKKDAGGNPTNNGYIEHTFHPYTEEEN